MSRRPLRGLAAALALASLLVGPTPAAAAAPPCVVSTDKGTWDKLSVTIQGEDDLVVRVDGWPLRASASAGTSVVRVEVEGPWRFEAAGVLEELPLAPRSKVTLRDGMLTLGARAALSARRVTEDGALQVKATWGYAASVDQLRVACDALDVRPITAPATPTSPTAEGLVAREETLTLYPQPKAKDGLLVRGPVAFVKTKKRGKWLRLETRWDDGSRLTGWARAADVKEGLFMGGLQGAGGGCGSAGVGPLNEAWLGKGAVVHSRPKGSAWARATRRVKVTVVAAPGQGAEYVRVFQIEGLATDGCHRLERAWVRADALTFIDRKK